MGAHPAGDVAVEAAVDRGEFGGGRAHLVQPLDPENLPEAGDILTYRCEDCADRWDLVVDEDDLVDP